MARVCCNAEPERGELDTDVTEAFSLAGCERAGERSWVKIGVNEDEGCERGEGIA